VAPKAALTNSYEKFRVRDFDNMKGPLFAERGFEGREDGLASDSADFPPSGTSAY
jgi:hypothetical protein